MKDVLKTTDILERVKKELNIKNDTELAKHLQLNLNTLYSWKNRNSFDINVIYTFCKEKGLNLAWVLTGEGSPIGENVEELKNKLSILEEELKKTDISCLKDNKETARLEIEINSLRAKLDYANEIITKLISLQKA